MEVTRTEMDDELNATLHCEDGRVLRINIGNLLHTHGKVAAVASIPKVHGPRLRLAVDTRGHGGYKDVYQVSPKTWEVRSSSDTPVMNAPSARAAAMLRAMACAHEAVVRSRTRTAQEAFAEASAQEASAQEASAQEASAQEDPPPVTSPAVNSAPAEEDEDDDVVFSHEVSREERDREGRRNAISLDDDE